MKKCGFYIISDKYFQEMKDPNLKGNKDENRPFYYCLKDDTDGIYWMIPLSSKVEKYNRIIETRSRKGQACDILHIARLDNGKENVFLLQDILPVTEKYIEREYTIAGNHMILTSEKTVKEIEKKARKILGIIKNGIRLMKTQADVLEILKKLKEIGA